MQKALYELNRDDSRQAAFRADPSAAVERYDLSAEEAAAIVHADIGLLYHLGVNGQILMHFAAFNGIAWPDYLQLMRDGVATHGPVREGIYALSGYEGTAEHSARLGQREGVQG